MESVLLLWHGGWVLPSVDASDQQQAVLKERPGEVDGQFHKVTKVLQLVMRGLVAWLGRLGIIVKSIMVSILYDAI